MQNRATSELLRNRAKLFAASLVIMATVGDAGAAGLPSLPPLPQLPIIGGGGGGGGGGLPGPGGPGGPGGAPGTVGVPSASSGLSIAGGPGFQMPSDNGGVNGSDSLNNRWGDPLSTDLLGDGSVHAKLRYYGESGRQGSTQAVGINLSFTQ